MANTTRHATIATLSALIFGLCTLLILSASSVVNEASAQSSVRPPSNATRNAIPGATPQSPQVPGKTRIAPAQLKGGAVPGGSEGLYSQSEIWRQIRSGQHGNVSIPDPQAGQLIRGTSNRLNTEADIVAAMRNRGATSGNLEQNEAGIMSWIALRNGPIAQYGLYGMGGMLALLFIFFLIRGRITIEEGFDGRTVQRFNGFERLGHWLLAISFIVLALTGLNLLYGKEFLIPLLGKEAFATIAYNGKLLHNYVGFAFMLGLAMIIIAWVKDNLPHPRDLIWLAKGGGILIPGMHMSAKKFNAGQKIIFWMVVLGGISISMSGIALMFPFETAMFAKTFSFLNGLGFNLPTEVTAIDEQKYASLWHSIVALFLICVILAHIYIGSIGMEGAFDAMGTGQVDVNWAREHHDLWTEEALQRQAEYESASRASPQPAE